MTERLVSPRYSSSGVYSTGSYSHYSFSRPGTSSGSTPLHESPITSVTVAKLRITEAISLLPSHAWIGKLFLDVVTDDFPYTPKLQNFSNSLWESMIKCDDYGRELSYRKLGASEDDHQLNQTTLAIDQCWVKCRDILQDSACVFSQSNSAYFRSPKYDHQVFMKSCIALSISDRSMRLRWVRIRNLMLYILTTI
jgi:hypothetical protein